MVIDQEDVSSMFVQDGYYIVHILDSMLAEVPRQRLSEEALIDSQEESKEEQVAEAEPENAKIFRAFNMP